MADTNAVSLQSAINRFAVPAGYAKVAVDGVVGTQTLLGARRALDFLSVITDDAIPESVSDQAAMFAAKTTTSIPVLAVNAGPLAGFLNYAAQLLKLPQVLPPIRNSAVSIMTNMTNAMMPVVPGAGVSTSLMAAWKNLATWQKLGLGILAGIGFMWAHKQWKQRDRASA